MTRYPDPAAEEPAADPMDEVLVAYLDGQLSSAESEQIESRLATDEVTRSRLQSLDRVWNALDALPRSTASAAFTRTTVDMAAMAASPGGGKPSSVASPSAKRRRVPKWLVAGVTSVAAGWMLVTVLGVLRDRAVLSDLPYAVHASALRQAQDVGFLQRFADENAKLVDAFRDEALDRRVVEWGNVIEASTAERRQWLDARSPAESADLAKAMLAYRALPDVKRQEVKGLVDAVSVSPQGEQLRTAALAYEAITDRLSATQRSELRQMPNDRRLAEARRYGRRVAESKAFELSDAEREALYRAIKAATPRQLMGRFMDRPRAGRGDFRDEMRRNLLEQPERLFAMVTHAVARGDRRPPPGWMGRRFEESVNEMRERAEKAWSVWSPPVIAALPDRLRARFDRAEDDRDAARTMARVLAGAAKPADLATAFAEELDADQVDQLLLEPRDEFRDAVSEAAIQGTLPDRRGEGPPNRRGPWLEGPGGPPSPGEGPPRRPPFARPPR